LEKKRRAREKLPLLDELGDDRKNMWDQTIRPFAGAPLKGGAFWGLKFEGQTRNERKEKHP